MGDVDAGWNCSQGLPGHPAEQRYYVGDQSPDHNLASKSIVVFIILILNYLNSASPYFFRRRRSVRKRYPTSDCYRNNDKFLIIILRG